MHSSPSRSRRGALLRVAAVAAAPLTGGIALSVRAAGTDVSGVTLVLGDQAGGLRALAEAARVLDGVPYRFRWANFQGAAPLFEAHRAGAIDLAPAGDLPVLTAALGDPALRIVATRVGSPTSLGIVVQPDSPVRTVADLKGRTVVVSSARGSISQYQLYGALREHGLAPTDVDVRFVLPVDAFAAFEAKQIAIWATFDPYYGHVVRRGARVVRDGSGINSGLAFLTSPVDTLNDRAKRAALTDVLARLTRAGQWALSHPADYANVYATLTRLPPDAAADIARRAALAQRSVSRADIDVLQRVADRAAADAILPKRVDVASIAIPNVSAT
ncbi:ABC transporter substrate-binding protein [Burkholderia multivorans]|uniref:ABC transporter substrate-binding protein n=1 Tax=Burkholderia multivorans TaxID=87883 RepID=UPI0008420E93|nr:ABC transporter substrate-binding protein [Burkholderia multivorans]AOJ95869.1 nitrate ABC transporter substrate-binding protein [Burkholderia multivorans]MBU9236971.1 ABC transporter substrate-binding protein [Burkholderia multivorans]MCO1340464.1 ABC transporter substrate-binding protein [Burkholderia multivorans]MCO1440364.1 ABC transporter substrate-binding protein [Burkholderia multivorans]MDR8746078.1 putative aliphatic sulfonates-binding protein [Burkholderia multivorans]